MTAFFFYRDIFAGVLNTINKKAVKHYVFFPKLRHCLKIVNLKSNADEYN